MPEDVRAQEPLLNEMLKAYEAFLVFSDATGQIAPHSLG
jgi:hypothetical protein